MAQPQQHQQPPSQPLPARNMEELKYWKAQNVRDIAQLQAKIAEIRIMNTRIDCAMAELKEMQMGAARQAKVKR